MQDLYICPTHQKLLARGQKCPAHQEDIDLIISSARSRSIYENMVRSLVVLLIILYKLSYYLLDQSDPCPSPFPAQSASTDPRFHTGMFVCSYLDDSGSCCKIYINPTLKEMKEIDRLLSLSADRGNCASNVLALTSEVEQADQIM
jgi:hypothetical protein